MAVFNPQVPQTNDPNWLSWSKPISQPESDKSAGVALQGIGNVLGEGLKTADTLVKFNLDDQIHAAVDKERTDYLNTLKGTYGKLASNGQAPTLSDEGASGSDILPEDGGSGPDTPEDLKDLSGSIQNLKGGRANGRLSQTDYYGRLETLASDFRSRYPGYVDYIDRQFEKNTGVNPANAQIRSLLGDINSFASNKNAGVNRAISILLANPIPGGDEIIKGLLNGTKDPSYAYSKVYGKLLRENEYKVRQAARTDYEGDLKLSRDLTEQAMTMHSNQEAADWIDTMSVTALPDKPKVTQFLSDVRTGKIKGVTDEQMLGLSQAIDANKSAFLASQRAFYNQPNTKRKDGLSDAAIMQDRMDSVLNRAAAGFDQLLTDAAGKNRENALAAMYNHSELIKARSKDALWMLQNDPKMGDYTTAMTAFGTVSPEFAMAMEKSVLMSQINKKLTENDKNNYLAGIHQLLGQPNLMGGKSGSFRINSGEASNPNLLNLGDVIDRINKAGRNGESVSPDDRNALSDAYTRLPQLISDPQTPDDTKVRIANLALSPANRGFIGKFENDQRMSVFTRMTDPAVTNEIWRLSQTDKNLWENYHTWAEGEFGQQAFKNVIQDLNAIPNIPHSSVTYYPAKGDQPAYFGLNVGKRTNVNLSEFKYRPEDFSAGPQGLTDPMNQSFKTVIDVGKASKSVNQLNDGLRSMSAISAKYQDMNAYLIRLMNVLGLDAASAGIPADMYRAVDISGRPPPVEKK